MHRLALLGLAVGLLGCPADDRPQYGEKPQPSASGASGGDAADADAPEAEPIPGVPPRAVVRDPSGAAGLRSGASAALPVTLQVENGAEVDVESCVDAESSRWCRVRASGVDGWAPMASLAFRFGAAPEAPAPEAPAPSTRPATAEDADGWTNLRTGPGTNFAVVTRILSGSPVEVQGACRVPEGGRSRWCQVKGFTVTEGDVRGWIAQSRLRFN